MSPILSLNQTGSYWSVSTLLMFIIPVVFHHAGHIMCHISTSRLFRLKAHSEAARLIPALCK